MIPKLEELKKLDVIDQLTWDESVNANNIHVEVHGDTVQLKGKVPDYIAKLGAERDAMRIPGVNHVENYLEIEIVPKIVRPSDSEITQNVRQLLDISGRINSANIKVETHDGVVTLTGRSVSYEEKIIAGEIAGNANGITGVTNKLNVKLPGSSRGADHEIMIP